MRVARLCDDGTILHGDSVNAVDRLDRPAAPHGYIEWLDVAETRGDSVRSSER